MLAWILKHLAMDLQHSMCHTCSLHSVSKISLPFWENTFNEPLKNLPMLANGIDAFILPFTI
jgi:hypothetical protein